MFTPSQIKTTIRPNTFTAQEAGMYSNAELDQFWNRILFSKHSDSTLQLIGKALSYSFISSNTPNYDGDSLQDSGNPYNTLRIGLQYSLSPMAKSYSVTHTQVLNTLPLFELFITSYLTILILYLHLFNFTFSIPITPSDTENYLPSDDPNITNFMISHYDCAKQHNLRQFNLLNVKQCTEAPSDIKHASVKARVYVRAKAKRIKASKCVAYAKKERKICFQGSVK